MKFFISILIILTTITLKGQQYEKAIGFRGGLASGLTYKTSLDPGMAFEGILSFRERGLQVTGLLEKHRPCLMDYIDNLDYYWGFGAHAGYVKRNKYFDLNRNNVFSFGDNPSSPVIGMDVIGGIEYKFRRYPITVGADIKPFFELFGSSIFKIRIFDSGFTVRYTFE